MQSIKRTVKCILAIRTFLDGVGAMTYSVDEAPAAPTLHEKQSRLLSPGSSDLTKDVVEVVIKDFDTGKEGSNGQVPDGNKRGNPSSPAPLPVVAPPSVSSQDLDQSRSIGAILQTNVDIHAGSPDNDAKTENSKAMSNQESAKEDFASGKKNTAGGERQNQFTSPDRKITYKDIVNRNMGKQKAWPSYQHEKCYVINADMIPVSEIGKVVDQFETHSNSVRFIYKKNILGFAFCTLSSEILDKIRGKYSLINVEEDKTFMIGSVENDMRYQHSTGTTNISDVSNFEEGIFDFPSRNDHSKPNRYVEGTVRYSTNGMVQSPVPTHFYRVMNMGNAFFNNYLLDNFIFRLFGISGLIKYFYKYEHFYTGRGVRIAVIDTPKCNKHKYINSSLISGFENSLAKNASLHIVEAFSCDGTIRLSKLLDILENMHRVDILVLPFSGPHSEALDQSLKRMGQNTIIVAASGNDSENSCNHSPSGHHLIKVGSVDKHGYISTFSNRGGCTNLYSLGEDVLGGNGTSYSASFVASAVAVFLEKHPGASHDKVLGYLMNSTMKNEYNFSILKIPRVDPRAEIKVDLPYYTWKDVIICNATLMIIIMLILYGLIRIYRRYRTRTADNQYILGSLREDRLQ